MWEGKTFKNDKAVGVIFTLHSPDGDEGYPGFVTVQVRGLCGAHFIECGGTRVFAHAELM